MTAPEEGEGKGKEEGSEQIMKDFYNSCLASTHQTGGLASQLVSKALDEVFASRVGKMLSDEQIRAVARDIKGEWNVLLIDDLSVSGTADTFPHRMLEKFCELMPESAMVCVLCDALYEADLQSAADKHFNPDIYTDKY